MARRYALIAARMLFGGLTLAAVITQLLYLVQLGVLNPVNFISYFTNLSNIFASVVFIIGAIFLLQRREPTPAQDIIRGASVAAMIIVGIVYAFLLQGEELGHLLPWVNVVTHIVMPLAVLADWIVQPPRSALKFGQIGYWLIYPLIYLVYTLIRGAIVGFYPYPFLNPAKAGGYGVVALYCVAIFVVFLVVGALLIVLGNWLRGAIGRAP
jgi:hypothetical protein